MTKITVLNTRPKALLKITREAFTEHGFEVIDFPCIEIAPETNAKKIQTQLRSIKDQDILIFTSQQAVTHAFNSFGKLEITKTTVVIAVGTKTAQVLEQNYTGDIWTPQQQDSEGVIDLLKGLANCQSIKLISAENGREIIKEFAKENDINFEQINVYKRQLPQINVNTVNLIKRTGSLFILATSVTTLEHIQILLNDIWDEIKNKPVICASTRIKDATEQLGFHQTINLNTADPKLMAKKLKLLIVSKHN